MDRIKRRLTKRRVAVAALVLAAIPVAYVAYGVLKFELPPPPILLNDPPPPVHTGGAPYPHGTIPPHLAPLWEDATRALQISGTNLGPTDFCDDLIVNFGSVVGQQIFGYEEELEDPVATITADLRAAGLEFKSITVRTKEYYDERYDPETFYNWLSTDNSRFDWLAAMERLGGEVHWRAPAGFISPPYWGHQHRYQVKIHGVVATEGYDKTSAPFTIHNISFTDGCYYRDWELLLPLLAGGLYTTFGDDAFIRPDPRTPRVPPWILLDTPTTSTLD